MHSRFAEKYLKCLGPGTAGTIKKIVSPVRYAFALLKGKLAAKLSGSGAGRLVFISGLPKSGTTWIEQMLVDYTGYVPIMPYKANFFEIREKSSIHFQLDDAVIRPFVKGPFLLKMHIAASRKSIETLRNRQLKYCIVFRDIRDAAVSYYFYVKHTPWHPEHPVYRSLSIDAGMARFIDERLPEWLGWFDSWKSYWDDPAVLIVRYESLLADTKLILSGVVEHFGLVKSDDKLDRVIRNHHFDQSRSSARQNVEKSFFRKGISGDWKNHLNESNRQLFKERAGTLLVELGYERDLNW